MKKAASFDSDALPGITYEQVLERVVSAGLEDRATRRSNVAGAQEKRSQYGYLEDTAMDR